MLYDEMRRSDEMMKAMSPTVCVEDHGEDDDEGDGGPEPMGGFWGERW